MSGTDLEDSLILLLFLSGVNIPIGWDLFCGREHRVALQSGGREKGLFARVRFSRILRSRRPPKDTPANNPFVPIGHHLG